MFSAATKTASTIGYQISRSLRFNAPDGAYLNRTPASASNQRTWTWSGWVKRSALSASRQGIFISTNSAGNVYAGIEFSAQEELVYYDSNSSGSTSIVTSQVFRDVSSWYHIVCAVDTTQSTASNRVKLYLNGSQITAFSFANYPPQNSDTRINSTNLTVIGSWQPAAGLYFNGYMTEINFIDGQALTPSSFGETNAQTGVWQPKAYSGSYGTNGFYLNFSDNSNTTAATLGKDYSGNGNNWTPNNFSVTAGAGNDSLVDSPTAYGTDTGAGGTVRGNYCTWNPLQIDSTVTLSNGNLDASTPISGFGLARGTIGVSSGKWYWEVTQTSTGANLIVGISDAATATSTMLGNSAGSYGYYGFDGKKINNSTQTTYGASFGNGDVIGVALDLDAGTLVFYKNNVSQGTAFTGLSGTFFPAASDDTGGGSLTYVGNFGQRPFAYTAPSGFKALCTQNLPTPTIGATTATQAGKFFNPVLYTGNSASTRSITGAGFQPDFVWIKNRTSAFVHGLFDAVRGVNRFLISNSTAAELVNEPDGYLSAFGSDGFTLSAGSSSNNTFNNDTNAYVAWQWKANGSGVTNTAGSITSTVSANTTSGFSIVTFTATANSGSIGHGLGVAPSMIILKSRNNTSNWVVYHASIGADKYLNLNTTDAAITNTATWQNTTPTSTVFYSNGPFVSGWTEVAYCFAEVPGFSAFGSYTGNGNADGPFVYTGFRPAYVMLKSSTDGAISWVVFDRARNTSNVTNLTLFPNSSAAENSGSFPMDFCSNGFKVRTSDGGLNTNSGTYIYAAFAESPFKYSLAR